MTLNYTEQFEYLRKVIFDDIYRFTGISPESWRAKILEWVVSPPINRFVSIATTVDQNVGKYGLIEAARMFIAEYANGLDTMGSENIPVEGPLLIASNHPGYYDGLAIVANLPRQDLKVIAGKYPFLTGFQYLDDILILTASDMHSKMLAIRATIQHLQAGGAVLIFPTGTVDPDPAVMPGAENALQNWSPSLELILRKVPQLQMLVTIISGMVAPASLKNPLARLRRVPNERQRVAEFIQLCQQAFRPHKLGLVPKVSYSRPFTLADLLNDINPPSLIEGIVQKAEQTLAIHTAR